MDDYREQYRAACAKAFEGFVLDLSQCRALKRDIVLQVYEMTKAGLFSKDIAQNLGISPKAVQKIWRRYSFPSLHNIQPRSLSQRQNWKGGVKLMKGYRYIRTPGHPNGTSQGNYVAEHRLVMEQTLQRYLLPTEVVDHIDGDITNNHPSNLRAFESNAEHLRETLKGKCPEWSADGKAALGLARRKKRRTWKGRVIEPIPET